MFHPPSLSQVGESPKDVYKCFASPGCLCPTGPFSPLSCKTITTQPFWHLLPVILNVDQCFQFSESFAATFFQEVRFILKNIYQDECSLRWTELFPGGTRRRKCSARLIYETICSPAPSALDNSQIHLRLSFSLRYYYCKKNTIRDARRGLDGWMGDGWYPLDRYDYKSTCGG